MEAVRIRQMRLGVICGFVVFVLLASASFSSPGVTTNAKAAQVDFHMGFLEAVDYLNPFRGLNDPSYELYGFIYDYLFSLDQDGHPIPNIATDASCDLTCRNWTYAIRQGVKWSDGTDLTADDVAFTVNYNIQNFLHLWAFEPYVNRIVGCAPNQATGCGAVITAPSQVTVYFDRPFAPGKIMFIPIIQKAQWQGISAQAAQGSFLNLNPIGTGPFYADATIGSRWQNSQPLLLHKNPNYHLGAPKIDNLYMEQFSDEATLVGALKAGAIDLAKLTPNGYRALANTPNIERQTSLLSTQYWNEIGFTQLSSNSVNKKLNPARWDQNVRRALAMATNKDFIVSNKYLGFGTRGDTLVSPITPFWWYDPTSESGVNLTFNLTKANQLLDSAGYSDWTGGTPGSGIRMAARDITFTNTNGQVVTVPAGTQLVFTMAVRQEFQQEQDTAAYLQQEWSSVGVQLNIKVELESALSNDVYGGAVETYIWYWSADPDPNYILSIESGFTLDGWNDNYWNNATYNTLYVDQLAAATNVTQRQQIVYAAEKVNYESAVYIIYIYQNGTWAYRTDRFTGWGDWTAHPYRQMDAFWGANPLFLELTPSGGPVNNCPTTPVIQPAGPVSTFTNTTVTFTGTASDPDQNQNLTWTWSWGDMGSTVHQTTTAVTQDTASHQWILPGTYNVSLAVFDGQCTKTSSNVRITASTPPPDVGWINGTVTDAVTAQPLSGATVLVEPGGYAQGTNATGAYSISVPVGTYVVGAGSALYVPKVQSNVNVSRGNTTIVDFALTPNFGWIAGTVTSMAGGGAISGAAILIYGNGQEFALSTNAQGKYNKSLAPGTYSVRASADGYIAVNKTGQTTTAAATRVVDFQLTPVPAGGTGISTLVYVGIGLAAIVAIAVAVFFLRMRRRRADEQGKIDIPPRP